MLSRQVMQVEIPPGLLPLYDENTRQHYYTIHVATPYGVSRELLVPAVCPKDPCAKPAAPPAPAEGFTLETASLTIRYHHDGKDGRFVPEFRGVDEPRLTVRWHDNSGSVPAKVRIQFNFNLSGKPLSVAEEAAAGNGGAFTLTGDQLKVMGERLVTQVKQSFGSLPNNPNPLDTPLTATGVIVTPIGSDHAVKPVPASPPLVLTFKPTPPPIETPKMPPVIQPGPVPIPSALPLPLVPVPGKTVVPVPPTLTLPTTPVGPPEP